jgi:hypothetical protein
MTSRADYQRRQSQLVQRQLQGNPGHGQISGKQHQQIRWWYAVQCRLCGLYRLDFPISVHTEVSLIHSSPPDFSYTTALDPNKVILNDLISELYY